MVFINWNRKTSSNNLPTSIFSVNFCIKKNLIIMHANESWKSSNLEILYISKDNYINHGRLVKYVISLAHLVIKQRGQNNDKAQEKITKHGNNYHLAM